VTPNQRQDLDKEMEYQARDYDKWKALNRRYKREQSHLWLLWIGTICMLIGTICLLVPLIYHFGMHR
jgi:hypothetical protein